MHRIIAAVLFTIISMSMFSGCGETVHGVVKDSQRIGAGVHKIFVRDN